MHDTEDVFFLGDGPSPPEEESVAMPRFDAQACETQQEEGDGACPCHNPFYPLLAISL